MASREAVITGIQELYKKRFPHNAVTIDTEAFDMSGKPLSGYVAVKVDGKVFTNESYMYEAVRTADGQCWYKPCEWYLLEYTSEYNGKHGTSYTVDEVKELTSPISSDLKGSARVDHLHKQVTFYEKEYGKKSEKK